MTKLTEADGRQSMQAHVAEKGAAIRARYGPEIDWETLQLLLQDRTCVRYPCEIVFSNETLLAGECARAEPLSSLPQDGFKLYVHPHFASRLALVPHLVLYHLVPVNYGPFASADDAETFGAAVLGLTKDEYYRRLCEIVDTANELIAEDKLRHVCSSCSS